MTEVTGCRNTTDVQELRRWARRIRRAERTGIRGAVNALRGTANSPLKFLRAVRKALAEYGKQVHLEHGVSRAAQLAHMVRLRVAFGLDPIAYYRFRLYDPERSRCAGQWVQTRDIGLVLGWLAHRTRGYPRVFRDKRRFAQWCAAHDLPFAPVLMEFSGGSVVGDAATLPAVDLFSKPADWEGGRGARAWIFDASRGGWLDESGTALSREELQARLGAESAALRRPMLLQQLLRNHHSVAGLVRGGLCTARVVTIRRPGRRAELLHAAYRMPVAPAFADNFALGGVAAAIDVSTGRLQVGVRKYPRVSGPLQRHPDTGVQFVGVQLPHWRETVDLVLRAHDAIDWESVPVIGWDVAPLQDGPVLIEGNNRPCTTFAQMTSGIPLGRTPFVSCVNAHIRERWHRNAALGTRNLERLPTNE